MTRIAIVGSRGFPNEAQVRAFVSLLPKTWQIVSGGAIGPDRWAEDEAKRHGRVTIVYKADWNRWGKRAGHLRNEAIARDAHVMVAFWDGSSTGTLDSVRKMQTLGKPTYVVGDGQACPKVELIEFDLAR